MAGGSETAGTAAAADDSWIADLDRVSKAASAGSGAATGGAGSMEADDEEDDEEEEASDADMDGSGTIGGRASRGTRPSRGSMVPHLSAMRDKITEVLRGAGHEKSRAAGLSIDDLLELLAAFNKADIHFA